MRAAERFLAIASAGLAFVVSSSAEPPRQVSDLRAFFRAGQTFLTWREHAAPGARYNIYRTTRPFRSSEDLVESALVATVSDTSSLNLMASINRLALSKLPRDQAHRILRPIYYVIDEGRAPLTEDTGLFVYTAKIGETAYYAVTAVAADEENRTLAENTLPTGVSEQVQSVTAIAQNGDGDYVHWADNVGTSLYPAMSERPSIGYNFRIRSPTSAGPHALIGVLHGALFQYNTPEALRYAKVDGEEGARAVRVAMDAPYIRGHIEGIDLTFSGAAIGTPGSSGGGAPIGWHGAADRVLWTMDWVAQRHAVDKNRYALRGESMGGIGAIQLALTRPERFAAIHAYVPAFGHERADVAGSRSPLRFSPYDLVKRTPAQDFPFILYTAGRADHVVQWRDKLEFAEFAQRQQLGFIFYWDAREHAYGNIATYTPIWGEPTGRPTMDLTRFSVRQSYPAVANLTLNDDVGTNNPLAARPAERGPLDAPGIGDIVGTINGHVDWDATIVDQPDRYEITLRLLKSARADSATADITPRRLQQFRPGPNARFSFAALAGGQTLTSGQGTADEHGRIQIRAVPLTSRGTRLVIER